jgi:hypothetical protein
MNQFQSGLAEGVRLSTHPDGTDESIMHRTNSCNEWCRRSRPDLVRLPVQEEPHPAASRLVDFLRRGVQSSLKAQHQRCIAGAWEGRCICVASMGNRDAACLPILVSFGCVEEVPCAGLKKLLDFSCMHSTREAARKYPFCSRLHKSDSSLGLTHHGRPPELGTLQFVSPLSRGHVEEVGAC